MYDHLFINLSRSWKNSTLPIYLPYELLPPKCPHNTRSWPFSSTMLASISTLTSDKWPRMGSRCTWGSTTWVTSSSPISSWTTSRPPHPLASSQSPRPTNSSRTCNWTTSCWNEWKTLVFKTRFPTTIPNWLIPSSQRSWGRGWWVREWRRTPSVLASSRPTCLEILHRSENFIPTSTFCWWGWRRSRWLNEMQLFLIVRVWTFI